MPTLLIPVKEKRIESDYYVEGYATTFDKPYEMYEWEGVKYYELIERNALNGADLSDVIMQYDHSGRVRARTGNKTLGIEPDDHGLFTYADLSKSSAAKELFEDISSGLINKMSWAFTVDEEDYDKKTHTRIIKRVKKIYDVSAVSIPANSGTDIYARGFFDGVIEEDRRESQVRIAKAKYFYFNGGTKC